MTLYYEQPKIKAHASTKKITLMDIFVERLTRTSFFDTTHSYKKRQKTVFPLKQLSALLFLSILSYGVEAADWYVRAGAGGNGTSWTSAWSNVTNITWTSINPGDTIWVAGGTYGGLVPGKSGNADTAAGRISIKRATAAAHGSATGWSSAYDAQVKLASISWDNTANYFSVDGQVDNGIYIAHTTGNAISFNVPSTYVTLRYIETAGPGTATNYHHTTDDRGIDITPSSGSSAFMKLQHVNVHGACTLLWFMATNNMTLEDSSIYDSHDDSGSVCHPNLIATASSSNVTIRNNKFYNYDAEGIMFLYASAGRWDIYGNVFDGGNGGPYNRVVSSEGGGANGPTYFYNNTVVNLWGTIMGDTGSSYASGSSSSNNIFWNAACDGSSPTIGTRSNNYSNSSCSGTGSISSGSNPFTNYAGANYNLISTIGAKYPKDKGVNLGSTYNGDMNGTSRGSDGAWDIGAYEYNSGSSGTILTLQAPQNLIATP